MQLVSITDTAMEQHNSGSAPKVKKEKFDEHEINQLAIEMAEKNRQKMITQAPQIRQQNQVSQQALQRAGGQQMITFYFNRDKETGNSSSDSLLPKKLEEKKKGIVDEESAKGRFGWTAIHSVHIPYIFRNEDEFCAVRMVELKLLNKQLNYLPHEITTCVHVRSYFITEIEAKLFNEINSKHCEFQFGREAFTVKDLIVRVTDAKCFHRFLDTCYKKLVQKSHEQSKYCGFVRINGESVVPYTVKGGVKYVPLFYFEGETDTLKLKAEKIEGWELAYLKFCCKVQGIRNELFASDTCAVVSLEDVKLYFPKETQFEDWWPQKTAEPMRILSHGTKPGGNWTQRPPMPPSTTSSQTAQTTHTTSVSKISTSSSSSSSSSSVNNMNSISHKATTSLPSSIAGLSSLTNNINNMNNLNSIYSQWSAAALMNGQAQLQQAALAAAYANTPGLYPGLQSFISDHMRGVPRNSNLLANISANSHASLRPPPLVRSNAGSALSQTHTSASRMSAEALRQLGYNIPDQANSLGGLVNSHHQTSNSNQSRNSSITTSSSNSHSQSKVPPPLIPVSNGLRTDNLSSHKGVGRIEKSKLVDVPPFIPDRTRSDSPYKVRKAIIDTKGIFCINQTAYKFSDHNMVALQDIIKEFFPTGSLTELLEIFTSLLRVTVYKANWHQATALIEVWGTGVHSSLEIVPLVKSTDVIQYLTQIKYIFSRQSLSQPESKRLRT